MFEALYARCRVAWDYLWQSTLFLGLGLGASLVLSRRPARAHRLLTSRQSWPRLITPVMAQAARRGGWGFSRLSGWNSRRPVRATPWVPRSMRARSSSLAWPPLLTKPSVGPHRLDLLAGGRRAEAGQPTGAPRPTSSGLPAVGSRPSRGGPWLSGAWLDPGGPGRDAVDRVTVHRTSGGAPGASPG